LGKILIGAFLAAYFPLVVFFDFCNQGFIHHMGATVFELLGQGKKEPEKGFRGSKAQLNVALKAIQDNKKNRYSSVQEFFSEWLAALE